MTTPPTFAFNTLVQPSTSVTQTTPSGFDADIANLLASVTAAVVQLYAQGITSLTQAMLGALPLVGGAASYQQLGAVFTAPEALGFGASAATASQPSSTPGAFTQVTIGVALQALDASNNAVFTVIALRGTQTYQEWVNDLTAIPQAFVLTPSGASAGSVHAGFYAVYTTGTDGQVPTSSTPRAPGSLAAQINQAVTAPAWPTSVPLYVTGHSLGAALAELCAMDLALNTPSSASSITMLNFAPPRVSAGFLDGGQTLPFDAYDPTKFVTSYQSTVKSSYSVVNAADLVPLLPATLGSSAGLQVVFSPVVPDANVVTYCAQLEDIGSNHELTINYLPYVQQLAAGFSAVTRSPARSAPPPAAARAPAAGARV